MKRLLSLALAVLMAAALFLAGGAARYARAEEGDEDGDPANPYVGLWWIAGRIENSTYTPAEEAEEQIYMDFLPNGLIHLAVVTGQNAEEDYLAYVVTEENQLILLDGDEPIPAEFDEESEAIVITSDDDADTFITFLRQVKTDPLPDVFALVDQTGEEQLYTGCKLIREGQALDLAESVAIMEEDPESYYSLALRPDGTGHLQLGSETEGADILWNETQFIAKGKEDKPYAYTRAGNHIVLSIDDALSIEFAPSSEVMALVTLVTWELENIPPVISEELAGTWELIRYTEHGAEVKAGDGTLSMDLTLDRNGTAVLSDSSEGEGSGYWLTPKGENAFVLSSGGVELYELKYDGTNMILTMLDRELFFKRTDG